MVAGSVSVVWSFEGSWSELIVGARSSFEEQQLEHVLLPSFAAGEVVRWFDDPIDRLRLLEIFQQLRMHEVSPAASTVEEMRAVLVPAIEDAFESRRLLAI